MTYLLPSIIGFGLSVVGKPSTVAGRVFVGVGLGIALVGLAGGVSSLVVPVEEETGVSMDKSYADRCSRISHSFQPRNPPQVIGASVLVRLGGTTLGFGTIVFALGMIWEVVNP